MKPSRQKSGGLAKISDLFRGWTARLRRSHSHIRGLNLGIGYISGFFVFQAVRLGAGEYCAAQELYYEYMGPDWEAPSNDPRRRRRITPFAIRHRHRQPQTQRIDHVSRSVARVIVS
jgi:hypothetical protein